LRLVVDASVAVKWFAPEEGHVPALQLLEDGAELAAPDLVLTEVANALHKKLRRGEATSAQCADAVETLPSLFGQLVPSATLIREAWWLAVALDHPVYDCVYLACAEHLEARLVTADRRFAEKARSAGHAERIGFLDERRAL
jgi:predicted nucleic acid-binding protein